MKDETNSSLPLWAISFVAFSLGVTSMAVQVVFLREFLSVFHGNELVLGVVLANWMALTGMGAFFAAKMKHVEHPLRRVVTGVLLIGILPIILVALLRILRVTIFPVGTMVDLLSVLWYSLVIMAPYGLVAGGLFTVLAAAFARHRQTGAIGSLYGVEAIGSLTGGMIFSILLAFILNSFQVLVAILALNLATALALVRDIPAARRTIWVATLVLLIPLLVVNCDLRTREFLFPDQAIEFAKDSPYGTVTVTRQGKQLNFFENNMLVGSTSDVVGAEEPVHYAMSQLRNPTSVLMIGGAASGAPREVLKYSIDKLDYVDLNPQSIQVTRQFTDLLNDQRITVVNEDPRVFLRANGPNYDAVLLNVPEPSTIQINRLFTTEFFGLVASRMNAGGVLSLGLQPGTDYQSDEARSVTSTIVNAIRLHFGDVLLVPGQRTYLLASDSVLDIRIGHLIRQRGIPTLYVNDSYLDDGDLERRSALLEEALDSSAPVNADLSPVSYYRHMVYWLSYFRSHLGIVAFFAIVLIMLATGKANVVTAGLLTSGFAASCIEVLLLVAFQTLYGYVYQMIGVIVTVFMVGLAVGALLRPKLVPSVSRRAYMMAQIGITAYALVLLLFLSELDRFSGASFLTLTLFMVLTFAIAALVGIVFSIAAELRAGDATAVASELYGVDLLGSALGALLVATILIPAAGFEGVCLIVGALTLLSGLLVTRKSGSTIVTG